MPLGNQKQAFIFNPRKTGFNPRNSGFNPRNRKSNPHNSGSNPRKKKLNPRSVQFKFQSKLPEYPIIRGKKLCLTKAPQPRPMSLSDQKQAIISNPRKTGFNPRNPGSNPRKKKLNPRCIQFKSPCKLTAQTNSPKQPQNTPIIRGKKNYAQPTHPNRAQCP